MCCFSQSNPCAKPIRLNAYEIGRYDQALPWRQQLTGLVRKVRRGEADCADGPFICALQSARKADPENPVLAYFLTRFILDIGEFRGMELWDAEI